MSDCVAISVWTFVCLFLGSCGGYYASEAEWKRKMVERGQAEYNATTGQWQWIDYESEVSDE